MVVGIIKTTVSEACTGFQVWMGSAQVDQRGQLHCFNPATVFEHLQEGLDLLAAAIPVAQLDNGFKAFCRQVSQQMPFQRLAAAGVLIWPCRFCW